MSKKGHGRVDIVRVTDQTDFDGGSILKTLKL